MKYCLSLLFTVVSLLAQESSSYNELHRPQFHFTPAKNWMNDPNGMVYYEGEYHLFYQFNPFGNKWGHMSWGHAVSNDLVHWEHLPLALEEENNVMIFSGCAVIDWRNTSGFGNDGKPPMIAIYTGHHTDKKRQDQRLAYSTDKGRTWTKYANNPVIDIEYADFRDPKVFWHEPSSQWVMIVTLSSEKKLRLYGSPDLKDWTKLSDFGPHGSTKGVWECPDLFPLPVEGTDASKWVIILNIGDGAPAGGSGCQYFVGDFDGKTFTLHEPSQPKHQPAFIPKGEVFADFENRFGAWEVEGEAFGTAPATGAVNGQQTVAGFEGNAFANSFHGGDKTIGKLTSPEFEITRNAISFLIGGGAHHTNTCINLLVDGAVVRTAKGNEDEQLDWQSWAVPYLKGRKAHIEILDRWTEGWGHINVDQIIFSDKPATPAMTPALWADYGRDFYAAVSWSDIPRTDGRRIWLGWMSNWQYAQEVPTSPWRSAMTVPRTLSLRQVDGAYRLLQKPAKELTKIRGKGNALENSSGKAASELIGSLDTELLDIELTLDATKVTEIYLSKPDSGTAMIKVDPVGGELGFYRSQFGETGFSSHFPGVHLAPLRAMDGKVTLRLLIDRSSIEIFANEGESVITDLFFTKPGAMEIDFGDGTIDRFAAYPLERIWK